MDSRDFSFGNFTPDFLDDLADRMAGKKVLEVFAGNGRLAAELTRRGVDITATTLFAGHDGHEAKMHHPVVELDAVAAVRQFGAEADLLLMSWPTTTEAAAAAVLEWGNERPVFYIGEITRRDLGGRGLGGCASDFFFEITSVETEFATYQGRGPLDRAVIMQVAPESVALWRQGVRRKEELKPGFEEELGWPMGPFR